MIKVIGFDLDNTLYGYKLPHQKALNVVYSFLKKEIQISKIKFIRLYDLSKQEIKRELSGTASAHNRILYFQRLIEKTHNTVHPHIILKLYNLYWNTFLKNMKLDRGVLETLKRIHKDKIKIAIVSDLTTNIQLKKIKKLGLTRYIDFLVTSEEAGSEKPHSIMFLLALNKMRLKPEATLFVGDDLSKDIAGSNAVGIESVLISRKKNKKLSGEDYKKANHVIKDIKEVLKILNE